MANCIIIAEGSKESKRLKQLIKKHGEEWQVQWGPDPMQCFNNEMGVHIRSLDGTHRRNIRFDDIWKDSVGNWLIWR